MNPAVKSFICGKTSVDEAAITSILSLVSHDKSAHSTNQANLFDYIVQREGQVKHMAMYYERKFTKLGYSAASILQSLPYLRMLLNLLAYFTHVVTLPFLYFVEVNSQNGLLEMFPRFFNDLKRGTIDTLKEYRVKCPHVQVIQPTTNVAQQLIEKMCEDAATVLKRQASQEYGFGKGVYGTPKATQLHLLSPEDRAGLPSNNLDAERHLLFLVREHLLLNFVTKNLLLKESEMTLLYSSQ